MGIFLIQGVLAESQNITLESIEQDILQDKILATPLHPYNPVLENIPKPVFDMNELEPKAPPEDPESQTDAPISTIINNIENYKETGITNNSKNPLTPEIQMYTEGMRKGMLIPKSADKIIYDPTKEFITYGDYRLNSMENGTIPPLVMKKGYKNNNRLWVYAINNSTRIGDQHFKFSINTSVKIENQELFIKNRQLKIFPGDISVINYHNTEYKLYLLLNEDVINYEINYAINSSNGAMVIDSFGGPKFYFKNNLLHIDDVKVFGNNELLIGGQGFIIQNKENSSVLITKDAPSMPINSEYYVTNGRILMGTELINVAPGTIYENNKENLFLTEKNGKAWYAYTKLEKEKFLFFFEKELEKTVYISASEKNKKFEEREKWFWNFLINE